MTTLPDTAAAAFRPLFLDRHAMPVGHLPLDVAGLLAAHGLVSEAAPRLTLAAGDVSERLEQARALLARHGRIGPLRGEPMPVRTGFDGPVIAQIDRSALRIFGFWAGKVHVNGLVRTADDSGPRVWLCRRSPDASAFPGCFDTLVAGGQALGASLDETAIREAWEEAGIDAARLGALRPVRNLPVHYVSSQGFHQELLAIYDLELDPGFVPRCLDGEIDEARCLSWDAFGAALAGGLAFKFGSRIVCEELVRRHGPARP